MTPTRAARVSMRCLMSSLIIGGKKRIKDCRATRRVTRALRSSRLGKSSHGCQGSPTSAGAGVILGGPCAPPLISIDKSRPHGPTYARFVRLLTSSVLRRVKANARARRRATAGAPVEGPGPDGRDDDRRRLDDRVGDFHHVG